MANRPPSAPRDPAPQHPDPDPPVAVALRSPQGRAYGTRVVATGRGDLAAQILEVARHYGVQIHSDADLAEVLAAIEVDSEIPLSALAAVAEILSYLYSHQDEAVCGDQQWEVQP